MRWRRPSERPRPRYYLFSVLTELGRSIAQTCKDSQAILNSSNTQITVNQVERLNFCIFILGGPRPWDSDGHQVCGWCHGKHVCIKSMSLLPSCCGRNKGQRGMNLALTPTIGKLALSKAWLARVFLAAGRGEGEALPLRTLPGLTPELNQGGSLGWKEETAGAQSLFRGFLVRAN